MPKSQRYVIRRKLEQVTGNLDTAIDYLVEIGAMYGDIYPEHFEKCSTLVQAIQTMRDVVEHFRKEGT